MLYIHNLLQSTGVNNLPFQVIYRNITSLYIHLCLPLITVLNIFSTYIECYNFHSAVRYNIENSRGGGKSIVFTHIFTLVLSPSSYFKIFFCYDFLSVQITSHYYQIGLLVTDSLSFPSSAEVLVSPLFLKDIFTEYGILSWQLFAFCTWKMCQVQLAYFSVLVFLFGSSVYLLFLCCWLFISSSVLRMCTIARQTVFIWLC